MKKEKASITIYLMLTLTIIMVLLCTVIESARVTAMKMRMTTIAYMAGDSQLSKYARPLFDDYGLNFLWMEDEEYTEGFKEYVTANVQPAQAGLVPSADMYGMGLEDCRLLGVVHALDESGEKIKEQAVQYMKYYLAEEAVEKILSNAGLFNQGDKTNEFFDTMEEYEDIFRNVEESVKDIAEKTDKVKALEEEPARLLQNMEDAIAGYKETGSAEYVIAFQQNKDDLKTTSFKINRYLEGINSKTEKYYDYVEKARDAVDTLDEKLEEDREFFDEDTFEAVSEQVTDLEEKSADTVIDYYEVGKNREVAEKYQNELEGLENLFGNTIGPLSEDNADSYEALVKDSKEGFSLINLDGLGVNFDISEVDKEDDGFIDMVSDLFERGIMGFIAGEVSEKTVDREHFPSVTEKNGPSSYENEELLAAGTDKVLMGEYILNLFGNYTAPKENTALAYEAEYVIGGQKSDADNLSAVAGEIVLLRTGLNLISLLKDSGKKAETYALATSIAGFTGMPIVIKIVQILLMGAWSLAEAMMDAKALLAGNKVETIKSGEDWYISLAGLKEFGTDALGGETKSSQSGLNYEAYLRILLLMKNSDEEVLLTADLIQANMCLRENQGFRFKTCIAEASMEVVYTGRQMFTAFPFVSRNIGSGNGGYQITVTGTARY
ncbi:MAG: hypothetical protein HUJ75_02240 [Parasporobacterium sp.]|nr:hypothetical protein [Parasporobacterium sp.]